MVIKGIEIKIGGVYTVGKGTWFNRKMVVVGTNIYGYVFYRATSPGTGEVIGAEFSKEAGEFVELVEAAA